jgi:hypothetical protein
MMNIKKVCGPLGFIGVEPRFIVVLNIRNIEIYLINNGWLIIIGVILTGK